MTRPSDPPAGKRDNDGHLITNPRVLKSLYIETYKKRLNSDKVNPELVDLFSLKTELWNRTLIRLEKSATRDWTAKEMEEVTKKLKKEEDKRS